MIFLHTDTLLEISKERSALFGLRTTQAHRERWGDSWYRAGTIVVDSDGKFLLVEERRALINGVWRDVEDMWNLPCGSCNPGEHLTDAAIRETLEELGQLVLLKGICLIKQGKHADDPALTFIFAAVSVSKALGFDTKEIKSQRAFSAEEIHQLNRKGRLRSPNLVMSALENYQAGLIVSLELLREI